MAKNGKLFGVCWTCGGKGHVLRDYPSPLQPGSSPDKGRRKLDDNCSPSGSVNVTAPSVEDGALSTASFSDLFADDLTNISSVASFKSLLDTTWDHIPSYLSDTSVSNCKGSMPALETVSNLSAATSMPDLYLVSDSDEDSNGDCFSEVEDDMLSDNLAVNTSKTSFEEIVASVGDGDMNEVATILSEVV